VSGSAVVLLARSDCGPCGARCAPGRSRVACWRSVREVSRLPGASGWCAAVAACYLARPG